LGKRNVPRRPRNNFSTDAQCPARVENKKNRIIDVISQHNKRGASFPNGSTSKDI